MELRAPRNDDAEAVLAVTAARELADLGVVDTTIGDVHDEWRRSEVDVELDTRVVTLDGRICGYAVVLRVGSSVLIDPAVEGRGVGTKVLAWVEARERERGARPHRQWISASDVRSAEFLTANRYAHVRSHHRMRRSLTDFDSPGPPPDGIAVRTLNVGTDAVALHAVDIAAFAGADDYEPMSAHAFRENHLEAHDTDRDLTCVAERDGRIVGFALVGRRDEDAVGHIYVLAVEPDQQGQGLGTALLGEAFTRIKRAGLPFAELGVSTTNPRALKLYERMGMTARFQFDTYERPLET